MARKDRKKSKLETSQQPLRETLIPSAHVLDGSYQHGQGANIQPKDIVISDTEEQVLYNRHASDAVPSNDKKTSVEPGLVGWKTSPDLIRPDLSFTPDIMYSLNNFLLGSPNMNSPHLFRADILYDSAGQLKTPKEKEIHILGGPEAAGKDDDEPNTESPLVSAFQGADLTPAPVVAGFELRRTVIRELIPRRPNLDRSLKQTCLYYENIASSSSSSCHSSTAEPSGSVCQEGRQRSLYLFLPDFKEPGDVPFYHPKVRAWGWLYDYEPQTMPMPLEHNKAPRTHVPASSRDGFSYNGTLSLHILPFDPAEGFDPFPIRLERMLQNLISTHIRLARNTRPRIATPESQPESSSPLHRATVVVSEKTHEDESYNPDKDNIIPRHRAQNTYSRLKQTYASDLCKRWVESTEPSKHVFEDLAIAAFLIELWRNMYDVTPKAEQGLDTTSHGMVGLGEAASASASASESISSFPGFVDIACGNGVLVYILLMEGYQGYGFDARRRKTWSIFPDWVQDKLEEAILIPKPFVEELISTSNHPKTTGSNVGAPDIPETTTDHNGHRHQIRYHEGIYYTIGDFTGRPFVISNHADELTVWTPLLAALACPEDPLPFLSIPCCSHALSGAKHRYRPAPMTDKNSKASSRDKPLDNFDTNPSSGDLRALRAEKQAACTSLPGSDPNAIAVLNSMYGSLTAKTMSVAEEIGFEVEKTLLRIPSTRNMGVIGGRKGATAARSTVVNDAKSTEGLDAEAVVQRAVYDLVERECAMDGGVRAAARIWIERAKKLQKPNAR